ncbi:MAG: cobalamin-dependent protein, partial [Desulfobacterales bacterium]|nr:cobalamin-dependent protein [Desulfobacterales bacterium]
MKIVLISMPDVAPVIMHESAFHMPNNGIASIGANIGPDHDVYVIDLIRKRRNVRRYLEQTLSRIRPDVVGLSSMTWQYVTCVKIVRLLRRWMPKVRIVLGGYHPTLMYEEISRSEEAADIDFIIRSEGEEALRRLIDALDGKDRYHDIPSLSFKQDGAFVHNPAGGLLDLDRLPLPIRDKRRLTSGYHIMNFKAEVMETSRGCTRTCNFCSIRHMYGRRYRTFPIRRVLADLDDIYYRHKTRWVFISDDNFVLDSERAIRVC